MKSRTQQNIHDKAFHQENKLSGSSYLYNANLWTNWQMWCPLYKNAKARLSELRSTTYKEEETPGDVAFVCIYAFLNAQSTGLL